MLRWLIISSLVWMLGLGTDVLAQSLLDLETLNLHYFMPSQEPETTPYIYRATPEAYQQHPEFGIRPFNASTNGYIELIDQRSIDARLFVKKGSAGKEIVRQQAYGAIHYEVEGQWVTIDKRLHPVGARKGVYAASQQPIPILIDLENSRLSLQLKTGDTYSYRGGATAFIESSKGEVFRELGTADVSDHTAGHDGVWINNVFSGIHRKHVVQRSEIKTDWIIAERPQGWPAEGYLVFEDTIYIDKAYSFHLTGTAQPIDKVEEWSEELTLHHDQQGKVLTIEAPYIYDHSGETWEQLPFPVQYSLQRISAGYLMQVRTDLSWIMAPERVFPIVIDPRVVGSSTYNQGYMAFDFSPGCQPSTGCAYDMTVIVPGKSTLVHAWFDAEYVSKITQSCGTTQGVLCRKKDAGFSIAGPCNVTNWSCSQNLPITTIPGLCYGDSVTGAFVNSVMCVPPSCPDHELDFQMRNYHCSCPTSGCDTSCHIMYPGTWSVYVAARTLEGRVWQDALVCPGDSFDIRAEGEWGVPPYTFSWQPDGDTSSIIRKAVTVPTTFVGTITDQCGETVTDSAVITIRPSPTVSLSRVNARCSNGTDGSATAVGGSTQGPYDYAWDTDPMQTTSTAVNLRPGVYSVTVTDRYGCSVVDSINVSYQNIMDLNTVVNPISCFGWEDGQIVISPIGTSPFQYLWNNGNTTNQLQDLPPGTYAVTVTDAVNCLDTFSVVLTDPDSFTVDAGIDQTILAGDRVTLNGIVTPAGNYSILWQPATGLSDPNSLTPQAAPDTTTQYTLRVALPDNSNCLAIDSITITVVPSADLFVPTGFTPNGDGVNDLFLPTGEVVITNIQVYNRWGQLVYEGVDGWDGTTAGQPQPTSTYMFLITYRQSIGSEEFIEKGNVTLLR